MPIFCGKKVEWAVINQRGFTLVELLVTVAILSILAAVAIPQYRALVIRSDRTLAFSTLKHVDNSETSYFVANEQYYPPNCSLTTPGCNFSGSVQVEAINEYLGLGRLFVVSGWTFSNDYTGNTGYATRRIAGASKSEGYQAHLTKDLDHIGTESGSTDRDWYIVHRKWAWGNPDQGIPFLHFDDILNSFGPY